MQMGAWCVALWLNASRKAAWRKPLNPSLASLAHCAGACFPLIRIKVFFLLFLLFRPFGPSITHYTQAALAITFTLTARRLFGLQLNAQVRRSVTVLSGSLHGDDQALRLD